MRQDHIVIENNHGLSRNRLRLWRVFLDNGRVVHRRKEQAFASTKRRVRGLRQRREWVWNPTLLQSPQKIPFCKRTTPVQTKKSKRSPQNTRVRNNKKSPATTPSWHLLCLHGFKEPSARDSRFGKFVGNHLGLDVIVQKLNFLG